MGTDAGDTVVGKDYLFRILYGPLIQEIGGRFAVLPLRSRFPRLGS
jgi:hypothetical protein